MTRILKALALVTFLMLIGGATIASCSRSEPTKQVNVAAPAKEAKPRSIHFTRRAVNAKKFFAASKSAAAEPLTTETTENGPITWECELTLDGSFDTRTLSSEFAAAWTSLDHCVSITGSTLIGSGPLVTLRLVGAHDGGVAAPEVITAATDVKDHVECIVQEASLWQLPSLRAGALTVAIRRTAGETK